MSVTYFSSFPNFVHFRRSGSEFTVGGFDLIVKNSEAVYRPDSTTNASVNASYFQPSLNIRLGNYVPPMDVPKSSQ